MILKVFAVIFCLVSLVFIWRIFKTWVFYCREQINPNSAKIGEIQKLRLRFFDLIKKYLILASTMIVLLVVLTLMFHKNK